MTILLLLKLRGVSPIGLAPGLSRGENTLLLAPQILKCPLISHWMDLSLEAFAVLYQDRGGDTGHMVWD